MGIGTVVLVNGASSAGKTSIARAWQAQQTEPYLVLGVDTFNGTMSRRYYGVEPLTPEALQGFYWVHPPAGQEERGVLIKAGLLGQRMIRAYHRAVAAMATAGMNLIVDDAVLDPAWLDDWLVAMHGIPVFFVGVRCSLEVNEQRERERGNRRVGQARGHFATVHGHGDYDFEVDSSQTSPEECARQIAAALAARQCSLERAFCRLRRQRSGKASPR